ncbi:hypothetical protein Glove_143g36 [Diversispora epigaea]|uniref:Uncharacterized protein n=1 Tax=Diversispora epigaea TaxID=1348612 RepID=A0A397IUG9_9GLOM|nr:hypothetical protein Glove_143g36 [Diversispora epigaea]
MVSEILSNPLKIGTSCKNNKRTNNLARNQIYDKIIEHLSGEDKIKQVQSYSTTTISCLADINIQNIINFIFKKSHNYETNLSCTYKKNLFTDFSFSPKIKCEVSENEINVSPESC